MMKYSPELTRQLSSLAVLQSPSPLFLFYLLFRRKEKKKVNLLIQATNPRLFLLGLALFQRERKAMTEIAVNSGIRKTWFYNLYCLKLSVYPSTNSNYAECFFSVLLFFRSIFGYRRIVFKGTWHLAWFNYHITKFIIAK